jgi:hypothetical protein
MQFGYGLNCLIGIDSALIVDVDEDARDVGRRKMKTKAFLKSREQRERVEMRFAHLRRSTLLRKLTTASGTLAPDAYGAMDGEKLVGT